MNMDLSEGSPGSTRLACKNAADDRLHLPASTSSSEQPFDRVPPLNYLQYDLEHMAEQNFVAIVDKADSPRQGWVLAEFSDSSDSLISTSVGLGRLLSTGLHVRLPATRPMMTEVTIPALHSSLLTYRLSLTPQGECITGRPLIAPLLRQSMPEPHESKFFVNVKDVIINLHGVAPFVPPVLRSKAAYEGISFQLWSDPSCGSSVDLSLKVDILGSLGELVMRYRTVVAAFPLLVVALVLRKQFQVYNGTGYFIPFMESLNLCLCSSLPLSFLVLSLVASSIASSRRLPPLDDPLQWRTNATQSAIDFTKNDLLLGAQDAFFWFLVPLFGLISIGVCVLLHYVVLLLLTVISLVYGIVRSKTGYIRRGDRW
jgi:GPI inositol-deacylase